MLDECLKALMVVGCYTAHPTGEGWRTTFPDGESKYFSDTQFKLICYRVYNEVKA